MTDNKPAAPGLAEALNRLMPAVEKAMKGMVFTAEKAGEVAADMNTIRAALASHPVPSAPEPKLTDGLIERVAGQTLGFEPDDLQEVNESDLRNFAYAIERALSSAPASAPEPSEQLRSAIQWAVHKVTAQQLDKTEQAQVAMLLAAASAPPVPAVAPAVEPVATYHRVRLDQNTSRCSVEWHNEPKEPGHYPLYATLPASPEPAK